MFCVKIQDRILAALSTVDCPLSPLELANMIGVNPESIRTRLSKMVKAGLLVRPFPQHYEPVPTYGVGSPPRVQNLHVVAYPEKNPQLQGKVRSHVRVHSFMESSKEPFQITLTYGQKRSRISYRVKAPLGLDLYAFLMVKEWADLEVKNHTGIEDLVWNVVNYEFLWDHMGVRLEGLSVITVQDLEGTLQKYYNKFYGTRQEVRQSPKSTNLDQMVSLVTGGIPQYQTMTVLMGIRDEMAKYAKGIDVLLNERSQMKRLLDALLKKLEGQKEASS